MISQWNEVIGDMMAELSVFEKQALELSQNHDKIGKSLLSKFGFPELAQFIISLESAKKKCREFLWRIYGVTKVSDLDFETIGKSYEGSLTGKATVVRTRPSSAPEPEVFPTHKNLTTSKQRKRTTAAS